jgi:hypothetical protein
MGFGGEEEVALRAADGGRESIYQLARGLLRSLGALTVSIMNVNKGGRYIIVYDFSL